jgi:hypothetical protein
MDEDGWQSKSTKVCSVFHMKDSYDLKDGFHHPHRVTCSLSDDKSEAALVRAYTEAAAALRRCASSFHAQHKFTERVTDSAHSRQTVWEAKNGKEGYRMSVQVHLKPPYATALFSIEFQPAN